MTHIRPLVPEDEPYWRRLWTDYLAFYESTVTEDVLATTFSRLTSGMGGEYRGLIADVDGRPVGLAHFLFHRHCWRVEDVCYLQDLYANPEVRGRGVGRVLIEAVYSAADEQSAPKVHWLTQHFDDVARRLYDQVGTVTPFLKYERP